MMHCLSRNVVGKVSLIAVGVSTTEEVGKLI